MVAGERGEGEGYKTVEAVGVWFGNRNTISHKHLSGIPPSTQNRKSSKSSEIMSFSIAQLNPLALLWQLPLLCLSLLLLKALHNRYLTGLNTYPGPPSRASRTSGVWPTTTPTGMPPRPCSRCTPNTATSSASARGVSRSRIPRPSRPSTRWRSRISIPSARSRAGADTSTRCFRGRTCGGMIGCGRA